MKPIVLLVLLLITGCTTAPQSPNGLKQNPKTVTTLHSDRNYQDAHRRLTERMRTCMATKFMHAEIRADGELYPDQQLGVAQLYVPGWAHTSWIILIESRPSVTGGSDITIYELTSKSRPEFAKWLVSDTQECAPK